MRVFFCETEYVWPSKTNIWRNKYVQTVTFAHAFLKSNHVTNFSDCTRVLIVNNLQKHHSQWIAQEIFPWTLHRWAKKQTLMLICHLDCRDNTHTEGLQASVIAFASFKTRIISMLFNSKIRLVSLCASITETVGLTGLIP